MPQRAAVRRRTPGQGVVIRPALRQQPVAEAENWPAI